MSSFRHITASFLPLGGFFMSTRRLRCSWCHSDEEHAIYSGGRRLRFFSAATLQRLFSDEEDPTLYKCPITSCDKCACPYHFGIYFKTISDTSASYCTTCHTKLINLAKKQQQQSAEEAARD